jgi:hypothetical protein
MSSVMSHAHRHDAIHQDALRDDFAAGARRPEHSRSARRASAKRSTYFFASSASELGLDPGSQRPLPISPIVTRRPQFVRFGASNTTSVGVRD